MAKKILTSSLQGFDGAISMNIQFQARERKLLIKVGIVFVIATMVPNMVSDYALDYQKISGADKIGAGRKSPLI